MLEPPPLFDAAITAALRAHYGIAVAELNFLPIGNDAASFVYRARASDGTLHFVKLRAGAGFSAASLAIPRYLYEQGLPHILAPRLTLNQTLWVTLDDFALSVYPYIEGRRGGDIGLTVEQWRAFGALVKQIHSIQLPTQLTSPIPRETFIPSRRSVMTEVEAIIRARRLDDLFKHELAAFWIARHDEIRALVERVDALGHTLRQASAPFVLCHGDMHTYNVLVDHDNQFWLIDWDEIRHALIERDLMFFIGGISRDLIQPHEIASFLQGYGDALTDPRALTYYRYAWAVQDMAANADQVFFATDIGEETRRKAVRGFEQLFEPGQIVEIAMGSAG